MTTPPYRVSARLVVLDERSRILMVSVRDPDDGRLIWITPGGGLEHGESLETGARRELAEEIEGVSDDLELVGPVWERRFLHTWAGREVDSHEWFFVARVRASDVVSVRETGPGHRFFEGWRWWTVEELDAFDGIVSPRRLAELIRPIIAGELPPTPIETGP